MSEWDAHLKTITSCTRCPRLISHCQTVAVEKRRAYQAETYWGKPIPPFGDPLARVIVLGLAPGAHGANRTGRIFTGDRSGEWLYRALYRAGFANQPQSNRLGDGLELADALVTTVVRCAPPANRPTPDEVRMCGLHLEREIKLLRQHSAIGALSEPLGRSSSGPLVWVALGRIALEGAWPWIGEGQRKPKFAHGAEVKMENGDTLLLSYHPSQQNTFTGRLTEAMLDGVFRRARELVSVKI